MGKRGYQKRSRIARGVLITQLPEALRREHKHQVRLEDKASCLVCRMAVCLEVGFLEEEEH